MCENPSRSTLYLFRWQLFGAALHLYTGREVQCLRNNGLPVIVEFETNVLGSKEGRQGVG